jgi:hypothetical protein
MATHRKRHHREERTTKFVTFDGLLGDVFRSRVEPKHVAIGAALALAGGALLKLAAFKSGVASKLPPAVATYAGPLATGLAAVIMALTQRAHRERAAGLATGGLIAAGLPLLWEILKKNGPTFTAAAADGSTVETPVFGDYIVNPDFGLLALDQPPQLPEHVEGFGDVTGADWEPADLAA